MHAGKSIIAENISAVKDDKYCFPCIGGNGIRGYTAISNTKGTFPIIGRQGALCGNINYAEGEFYATEHAVVVDTFCETNTRWAYYFLIQLDLNQYATATAQPGLSVKTISDVQIPVPPKEEQERIVIEIENLLALIDELDANSKNLLEATQQAKSKILELAIHGKLVSQDPNDEPASELLKRIAPNAIPCDTSHYPNLPTGWSVCRLADIVTYEQPTQYIVGSTDYRKNYKTPVLTAGKSFVLGYTNETNGIYDKLPAIIFDDFTTDSRLVDFPFKVKSSAMKILQVNKGVNIKYVAYFMSITRLVGDTHKRYWISEYSEIPIPLPPINEQNKIVEIIRDIEDKLQAITDEL